MEHKNKEIGFIHIPKTGGKTFLEFMKDYNINYNYKLHKPISDLWDMGYKDLYNITIVRHPYSRVLSFYSFYKNLNSRSFSNLEFDDYISNLSSVSKYIKPCYDFCTIDGERKIDFIIKLEQIEDDIEILKDVLGLEGNLKIKHENKSDGYIVNELSNSQKDKIISQFKNDFEYFNYET